MTSQPREKAACAAARTAAFIPGATPPLVSTTIFKDLSSRSRSATNNALSGPACLWESEGGASRGSLYGYNSCGLARRRASRGVFRAGDELQRQGCFSYKGWGQPLGEAGGHERRDHQALRAGPDRLPGVPEREPRGL